MGEQFVSKAVDENGNGLDESCASGKWGCGWDGYR